jgi:antitoxin VapB
MGISIRDPQVAQLARELARLRKTNMTEAIAHALRNELERERNKRPLEDRLEDLANETMAMARPGGHALTKEEIDELWGQ